MLRGLFPRLFSQFREAGLIVGQFLVSNSGATLTPTSNCYTGLTAVGGDGTCVVTLAGGARKIVVVSAHASMPDADDQTEARYLSTDEETGISAGAGTVPLAVMKMDGTEDQEPLVDGSVVTVTLLVDK